MPSFHEYLAQSFANFKTKYILPLHPSVKKATLTAGSTTLTFSSLVLTGDDRFELYSNKPNIAYKSVSVSAGSIDYTFDPLTYNVRFYLMITKEDESIMTSHDNIFKCDFKSETDLSDRLKTDGSNAATQVSLPNNTRFTVGTRSSSATAYDGKNTITVGTFNYVSGDNSTAFGRDCLVKADCSAAFGRNATVSDSNYAGENVSCTIAMGKSNIARQSNQLQIGGNEIYPLIEKHGDNIEYVVDDDLPEATQHAFGVALNTKQVINGSADVPILDAKGGYSADLFGISNIIIHLTNRSMYLLVCSGIKYNGDESVYGSIAALVTATGGSYMSSSYGTPTILILGQSINVPAVIEARSQNRLYIENKPSLSLSTYVHLIRLY